jgi:type III secretion protein Q
VLQFSAPAARDNLLTLVLDNQALWAAALTDGVLTLTHILSCPETKDTRMAAAAHTEAAPAPGAGLSAAEINALEVRLTLELEERRMTVGELAALTPGVTLETTASLESPVTLKVNGRAVGKGRLVEVGDRLGVMLTALSLDDAGTQE